MKTYTIQKKTNQRLTRRGTTYSSYMRCYFVLCTAHKHKIQNIKNSLRNISIVTLFCDLRSYSTNLILVNATT